MASAIEIFFCYAREDEELLKGLEKQLHALKLQGIIDVWHDRQISAGSDWEREIDTHLNSAHIILLLVSPDFMVSSYCYSKEMMRAMERHERGEACVIPVILRPVYWQGAPFGKLQALPKDAKAVASRHWYSLDEAFYDVAQGIYAAVQELTRKLAAKAAARRPPKILPPTPVASTPFRAIPAVKTQKTKEQWIAEGIRFRDLKQYSEALAAFEETLRLDPNDAFAYFGKGFCLVELKQYEKAVTAYEQAIRLNPKNAVAYSNKGAALNELKRYEEALEACEQSISLDPKNAAAYESKGVALKGLKRYKEASAADEQAENANKDALNEWFEKVLKTMETKAGSLHIPNLQSLDLWTAVERANQLGMSVVPIGESDSYPNVESGRIVMQLPPPGTLVDVADTNVRPQIQVILSKRK